jgi:glycosyltransferase involved in cell wall biosynthesis
MSLKVLLVSEYFPPVIYGGGEISAYLLAKNLAKYIDVSVLTSNSEELKNYEEKDKIKIYRRLETGDAKSLKGNIKRTFGFQKNMESELSRLDNKENFDIIHFLNTTSIPSFKIDKKTIATINNYTNFCPKSNMFYKEKEVCKGANYLKCSFCIMNSNYIGKVKMPLYLRFNKVFWFMAYLSYKRKNKSLRNVDKFIAVSDYAKELLIKNRIKQSNVEVIPNLLEIKESKKIFDINENRVKITSFGVLEKIKGIDFLIRAFNKTKDADLLIFGDGSQKSYLKKLANNNVKFYGKVDYLYTSSIYKQSDIIVLPSLWPEPLSRILLEATYYGKPIIATDVGGNKDAVINNKNGFLVKDEGELAEKLHLLISDRSLREKMEKESRKIFKQKFDNKKNIKKIIQLYKR